MTKEGSGNGSDLFANSEEHQSEGIGFESITDPAADLFALPEPFDSLLSDSSLSSPESILDRIVTVTHQIPLHESSRPLLVQEHATLRCWLQRPKRAVLLLPGAAADSQFWSIPSPGYHAPSILTRNGFFTFTADYPAAGINYWEGADGRQDCLFATNLDVFRRLLQYIRYIRAIRQIDIIGESWGGVHALYLANDSDRVRSCTMAAMKYKEIGDSKFASPEFAEFLKSLPDNYVPIDPGFYRMITAGAPDEVVNFTLETQQPSKHPTDQLWQVIEKGLPYFDPSIAQVPGLVISGSASLSDNRSLAEDYGANGAQLVEIEGAGHAPRLETPAYAGAFWREVLNFLKI